MVLGSLQSPSKELAYLILGAYLSLLCSVQQSWSTQTYRRPLVSGPGESHWCAHIHQRSPTHIHKHLQNDPQMLGCAVRTDIQSLYHKHHSRHGMFKQTDKSLYKWRDRIPPVSVTLIYVKYIKYQTLMNKPKCKALMITCQETGGMCIFSSSGTLDRMQIGWDARIREKQNMDISRFQL